MLNIDELKFDGNGLIPAVVTDADTGQVLTLAYMNRKSLEITVKEGRTCFWSRSRQSLWRKGETSGNYQTVVDITADCDRDALIVRVVKAGPACHLGTDSCFVDKLFQAETVPESFSLEKLYRLIEGRKTSPQAGSYTSYLFEKGIDKILKKVGEECTEVVIAAKGGDREETVFEVADLTYHVLVLLTEMGISLQDVKKELAGRHVVDKKVKQEHMK